MIWPQQTCPPSPFLALSAQLLWGPQSVRAFLLQALNITPPLSAAVSIKYYRLCVFVGLSSYHSVLFL